MTTATIPQTEAGFQDAVLQLARFNGWLCYHVFDSRRSQAGFPDLVMVRTGELIFAELKTDKGRVTHDQTKWIGALTTVACQTDNVRVFVWRPVDWPTIEQVLARG